MTRNIIITVIAIALIIVAVRYTRSVSPAPSADSTQPADTTARFGEPAPADEPGTPTKVVSGTIIEKDDGCFADGICRINVDGTWVITNQGWYQGPLGTVADNFAVGMRVEAYGKVTTDGITMLGSNDYYVKVK